MGLDTLKSPESKKEEAPIDILRKTRFTRMEGEPPRINFYDRLPEKGGTTIFSLPYSQENLGKYFPAPKEVPPYSPEEVGGRRNELRSRLAAIHSTISPEMARELGDRIDAYSSPKTLNDVEDDIFAREQRPAAEKTAIEPVPEAKPFDREQLKKERQEQFAHSEEELKKFAKIQIPGVEGPRGRAWFDPADGSMRILNDDGYILKIAQGGFHTFGNKESTVTKKWLGPDRGGWTDLSPEEFRAQRIETEQQLPQQAPGVESKIQPSPQAPAAAAEVRKVRKVKVEPEAREGVPGVYSEKSAEGITYHEMPSGALIIRHGSGAVTFATPEQKQIYAEAQKRQQEIAEQKKEANTRLEQQQKEIADQLQEAGKTSFEKPPKTVPEAAPAAKEAAPVRAIPKVTIEIPVRAAYRSWRVIDQKNYEGVKLLSLDTIVRNPENIKLFYDLLDSIEPTAAKAQMLGKILHNEPLTKDEKDFVEYGRYEFSKWYPRAEALARRVADKHKREDVLKYAMRERRSFEQWEERLRLKEEEKNPGLWKSFNKFFTG